MSKYEKLLQTAKPILFNTEMVKAILEGRKSQTRIVIKLKDNSLQFTGYVYSTNSKKNNSCAFGKTKERDLEYDSYFIENIKIIDTIQENKLGLIN